MEMIILKYRKTLHHEGYPWIEECETPEQALAFIIKLGKEYDFLVFKKIGKSELKRLVKYG